MTAGLPGIGLSGLWALASALFIPIDRIIARHDRSRSDPPRTLFTFGVVIVAAIVLSWEVVVRLVHAIGGESASAHHQLNMPSAGQPLFPTTLVISLGIILVVVGAAELLLRAVRPSLTPTPPPVIPRPASTPASAVEAVHALAAQRPARVVAVLVPRD